MRERILLFTLLISGTFVFSLWGGDVNAQCKSCNQGAHNPYDSSALLSEKLPPNGNSKLDSTYIQQNVCGLNYLAAAAETTTRPTWQPGTAFPTTLTLGPGGCIQKAYLYYEASYTEGSPPTTTVTFTNPSLSTNTVPSTIIGTSGNKCWGETGTATYRADVTPYMTGSGNYIVDLNGFANKNYEVDGVTLIEIYIDKSATYSGSIVLYDGCYTALSPGITTTLAGFNVCSSTSNASGFGVFADMQSNVAPPNNTEIFNGTSMNFPNNFWNFNVIPTTVTTGQTSSLYQAYTNDGGDCYCWILASLYWQNTNCLTCTPSSGLTLSPSSGAAACGNSDGSAEVGVTGGTSPYTYIWNDGATTSSVTGLSAGTYTVNVKDATGCNVDSAVIIVKTDDSLAAPATTKQMITCNGDNNGSAYVTASGGFPTYSYSWSNGATTDTVKNLTAGTYTVTTTDNKGCAFIATVTITQPPAIIINVDSSKNPSCYGSTNGDINISASGGNIPYTYLWSPTGGTDVKVSNLSAGTYTIMVTDANGCSNKDSITLTQPARIVPTITGGDSVCLGSSLTLTANAPGATSYSWTPPATVSCPTCSVTNVTPTVTTTYTVTATNGTCTGDTTITVFVKPKPTAGITIVPSNDTICIGDSALLIASGGGSYIWTNSGQSSDSIWVKPGSQTVYFLQVTTNGCIATTSDTVKVINPGTPTITLSRDSICPGDTATIMAAGGKTYKWLPPLSSTNQKVTVNPNSTTTFSVVVTNPCGSDTLSATVHIVPPPSILLSGDITLCKGSSATLTASGGISYTWSPSASLSCNTCPNPTASPTVTTTYTVQATNGRCTSDTTITVTVVDHPVINLTPPQNICIGNSVTLTASGGGTYLWSNGATTSSITVSPDSAALYTVIVNNGCIDSAKTGITVDNPGLIACCNTSIPMGDTVTIHAIGDGNYSWAPPNGLSCTNCANPVASPTVTTTYTVTSVDSNGCEVFRTVTITLECNDFDVPNVFTPNDDGINDDFVVRILNYSSYSIIIYDRWGKKVYNSTDPTKYWNGRINGSQYLVPDGVYYYIIKATCGDNNYLKKGFVHVMGEK